MKGRRRVQLIHWKAEEAEKRTRMLRDWGYSVKSLEVVSRFLKDLRADPPDALIIDLTRLPAQGRDVGVGVRHQKATRRIPLVFVGGVPEKVEKIREQLPDAAYCDWEQLDRTLRETIANPPVDPIAMDSVFAGYAGRPLAAKLTIKAGQQVALIGMPEGFESAFKPLPDRVALGRGFSPTAELAICFVRSGEHLGDVLGGIVDQAQVCPVWIAWPKKMSRLESDLTQQIVRERAMAAGLVDYKIISIDKTWSGLLFTVPRPSSS